MNDGFINEEQLISYINARTFVDYTSNIQAFLTFVFGPHINRELPFKAQKIAGQSKPDMSITHNTYTKYISVKKGSGNSVHQEPVNLFFEHVKALCGEDILLYLKKFHYGDDTTNNTGKIRYSADECKKRYAKEIILLNESFNESKHLSNFLERFLFQGNVGSKRVDTIYHGTINLGLWASREEIINYITETNFPMKAVHFGPLTYQVWGRDESRTAKHPDRRYVMQVKWGSIMRDLANIRNIK